MTVNAGDILRATVNWQLPDATIAQNVSYYLAGAGVGETDANTITVLRANLEVAYNELAAIVDNTIIMGDLEVAKSDDGGATFFDLGFEAMSNVVYTDTTDMVPHGVAAVVRFGGVGTGREGRKFICGIGEDQVLSSTLTPTAVTALVNYALNYNNDINLSSGTLFFGWLRRSPLGFVQHSGTITVNTIVGYQRRRKPGVGI